jgi:PKHD-type hydroxylase
MSAYHLSPSPDLSTNEQNFATWENGFSDSELATIKQLGDKVATNIASVNTDNDVIKDLRQSQIGWLGLNDETQFIYDKIGFIVRSMNGQFWDFDIYGFVEDLQYTVYNGTNDHYDWHMDKGNTNGSPRKLSVTLLLSDPSEYEGGDLQFWIGGDTPITVERKKGLIHMFPSYILHRVTPVTRGTRKSLVVWIAGKKFK